MSKVTAPRKVGLTIRIDPDILERLELHASTTRIPKAIHVQQAVLEYLDSKNAPWPKPDP